MSKINPTGDPCRTKYYTPFGSGVSLSGLTRGELTTTSCWNCEPSKSNGGVIGKPLQSAATVNKINTSMFPTVAKLSDFGTKASSRLTSTALLGFPFEQQKSNRSTDKVPVTVRHQNTCGSIPNYHAGKTPTVNAVGIPREGRCIAAEQQQKQLLANQQVFMQELNRLPPDLRKQYVDYMIASHLGLLPTPCQTVPAVHGMYYSVAVGPTAVPVAQMFASPVIMPTPVITLQPVAPSSMTKSVSR